MTCALQALLLVDAGMHVQQSLAVLLPALFPQTETDARWQNKKNLCSDLVYGYLRAELRIMAIVQSVLRQKKKLPRPMLLILGLAIFSLLLQDRHADHAVVHESVDMVRRLYGGVLAGLANACLRTVQRRRDSYADVDFYRKKFSLDAFDAAALFHAVPCHVARHWRSAYGQQAALHLLRRSSQRPWSAFRINAKHDAAAALRSALHSLGAEKVADWGLAFPPGSVPQRVLGREFAFWLREGALSQQAAGSQRVLESLGLYHWEGSVCDFCAGFGGKTAALLEQGVAVTLCLDKSEQRLRGLPRECRRLGLLPPVLAVADGTRPPLSGWNGHILLDAPCSGLGVLSRRPDIRRRVPSSFESYRQEQIRLLCAAYALLPPGRQIAYVTCTVNPEENEQVVFHLLQAEPKSRLVRQWQTGHEHPWHEGMYGALVEKVF
ncbi:MAG: RsmB/NOP family class I SAM-dependent RNA methyltransferase [Desulfovibrio sp.]|nr:RsmB/NOP family class I SAM-dependent RNA methyltransferase [Desulfovibrio sp.]